MLLKLIILQALAVAIGTSVTFKLLYEPMMDTKLEALKADLQNIQKEQKTND